MKKLFLIFALGLGLTIFAQGTTSTKQQMIPTKNQKSHLDKLTKELTLNINQQQQVAALMTEKSAKMHDMKVQKDKLISTGEYAGAQKESLKKQMVAERKDYDAKMKAILTPEQYQKWMMMKEEHQEDIKAKVKKM